MHTPCSHHSGIGPKNYHRASEEQEGLRVGRRRTVQNELVRGLGLSSDDTRFEQADGERRRCKRQKNQESSSLRDNFHLGRIFEVTRNAHEKRVRVVPSRKSRHANSVACSAVEWMVVEVKPSNKGPPEEIQRKSSRRSRNKRSDKLNERKRNRSRCLRAETRSDAWLDEEGQGDSSASKITIRQARWLVVFDVPEGGRSCLLLQHLSA